MPRSSIPALGAATLLAAAGPATAAPFSGRRRAVETATGTRPDCYARDNGSGFDSGARWNDPPRTSRWPTGWE